MTHAPRLLHVYPTFDLGGAQRRFVQLANHFGRDFRHLIVSLNGGTAAFEQLGRDVEAEIVEVPGPAGGILDRLRTVRGLFDRLRPDLLVTSNWGSIEWAIANMDHHIAHLHMEDGFGPDEAVRQLPRRVWARRLVLRRSTVMLPSRTLFRLAQEVWRLPRRVMVHVPNGIDCERFSPRPDLMFSSSLGIRTDRPVIGTVAALRREKCLERLIEAFAQVRRSFAAQLVIVGEGPERAALAARVADLALSEDVLFTGACGTPERLLPSFSVFALSSDTEQMPLSLLEAMAAGRPVAATDVGDVKSMLVEENRSAVVPREAASLAGAIAGLLGDPAAARAMGEANAKRAREIYDQQRMFDAYRKLYTGGRPD